MMLPLHGALVARHCEGPLAALRVGPGCLCCRREAVDGHNKRRILNECGFPSADGSSRGVRPALDEIGYLNESYFQKRGVCTYTYVQTSPAPPAAMCMGGGLSIVIGLRELRLEGLAADERVLVGDGPYHRLAPVPHQGVPDGDDFGGDGGRVDVGPDAIAANIL